MEERGVLTCVIETRFQTSGSVTSRDPTILRVNFYDDFRRNKIENFIRVVYHLK